MRGLNRLLTPVRARVFRISPIVFIQPKTSSMRRGVDRVGWTFAFTAAAYNLVRVRTLLAASG